MSTPSFFKTHPRVCALILATTTGARLFPMTSTELPKHILPIAGIPCILRLLESLEGLPQVVVAISAEDSVTLPLLQKSDLGGQEPVEIVSEDNNVTVLSVKGKLQTLTVIRLSSACFGTVDALREVEETKVVHVSSRLVVIPGDLVFFQKNINLDPLLRPPSESDCAVLLVDVGEVDEHGIPLKESVKVSTAGILWLMYMDRPVVQLIVAFPSSDCRQRKVVWQETKRILSTSVFRILCRGSQQVNRQPSPYQRLY